MRIGTLISGVIATVLAVGLLLVGGALVLIDDEKDRDGYLTTSTERFSSDTRAIATENIDLDLDGAGWLVGAEDFGKVRVRVDSNRDEPVFAGVARTADVERYLAGVSHATLTDIESSPFEATYEEHVGRRTARPPARSGIWAASASGTGRQDLVWDVEDGDWSVVVMNADGSKQVDASISAGAKLPDLAGIGWATMGGGGLLLAAGIALSVLSTRPRRPRPATTVSVPAAA